MPSRRWCLLQGAIASAEENMATDLRLLEALEPDQPPCLHLYRWEAPCATYGHFCHPELWLDLEAVAAQGWQLARRPTGGAITFHICDLAFAVLVPASHPAYQLSTERRYCFVNGALARAVARYRGITPPSLIDQEEGELLSPACGHFCMARPTRYDLVIDGAKLAGAAQRCTKRGFLHQGSLFLAKPPLDQLAKLLRPDSVLLSAFQRQSLALLDLIEASAVPLDTLRQELGLLLFEELQAAG